MHSSKKTFIELEDVFGFLVGSATGGYYLYQYSGNIGMVLLSPLGGIISILFIKLLEALLGPVFLVAFRLFVSYVCASIFLGGIFLSTPFTIDPIINIGGRLIATVIITALWFSRD